MRLLTLLLFLSLGLIDNLAKADGPGDQPNVIVILADDLGFSDLGCYGGEIETPNLDSLAAGGLRFTQFYNTGRCWPTRASLLTGYYAQQVRRDKLPGVKPSGAGGKRPAWGPLLPKLLDSENYRSYHSGKWHIDSRPVREGFDRSYFLGDQARFFSPKSILLDDKPQPAIPRGTDYYATTAIADHMIDVLKEHEADHKDKAFFHYIAFTAPHFPLHALPEDIEKYKDRYLEGWEKARAERWTKIQESGIVDDRLSEFERETGAPYKRPDDIEAYGPGEVALPLAWDSLTDEQRRFQATKMAIHAAMIDRMDQEIGRILEQLKAMDEFEDTLIFFLSDNGASAELMIRDDGHDTSAEPGSAATHLCLGPGWSTACNTPFRKHKTWVHEGGIATPLIAHWPAGIAARGELRHQPGHLIDMVPTILELAGQEHKPWSGGPVPPGKSLLPVFENDASVGRDFLWWYHDNHSAIRVGDWKAVKTKDSAWELFDLSADRAETNDLADSNPQKRDALIKLWQQTRNHYAEQAQADLKDKPNAK
jgi:arylsulfatase